MHHRRHALVGLSMASLLGLGACSMVAPMAGTSTALTARLEGAGEVPVAAHFHGAAVAGQGAGVVVPITGPLASPVTGSATLSPNQVADPTVGKWYVNVHTTVDPGEEIPGQVRVRP